LTSLTIYNNCPQKPTLNTLPAYQAEEIEMRQFGEIAVVELAKTLTHGCCPQLEILDLANIYQNASPLDATGKLMIALANGRHPRLRSLNLATNLMGDSRAVKVVNYLCSGHARNLEVLNMKENYIGQRGVAAIIHALRANHCPKLKVLDLSGNILTDRDGHAIANCLVAGSLPHLTCLHISQNFIGTEGFNDIAKVVASRSEYRRLQVYCAENCFPNHDAEALLRAHTIVSPRVALRRNAKLLSNSRSAGTYNNSTPPPPTLDEVSLSVRQSVGTMA